jgi:alkylresorcinol/alkylpyrone synthase
VTRFVRAIFSPTLGIRLTNAELLGLLEKRICSLDGPVQAREALTSFVRLQLLGNRSRYCQCPDFLSLTSFAEHALAFESAVEQALAALAAMILEYPDVPSFDAVVGVSSSGQLLPGIADRARVRLKQVVRGGALLFDVGNGGCTAGVRALQAAARFDERFRNILLVITEPTSALADSSTFDRSSWQGICTFGDGAAAVWISDTPAAHSLSLAGVGSRDGEQHDLIRWDYGSGYYRFGIPELARFESNVRRELAAALAQIAWERDDNALWALHPAGMLLLLSIAKKLSISRAALEPSIRHFREFSNMSGASLFHILRDVLAEAQPGQTVRWLSMGAGFHVEYGDGRMV